MSRAAPRPLSAPAGRLDDLRGASMRLTALFTGLMLVVLVLMGVIVFGIVSTSVAESGNRALSAATRLDSPQDAPDGTYLSIVEDGRVLSSRDMPAGLVDTAAIDSVAGSGGDVTGARSIDGHDYRMLTTTVIGGRGGDRVVQVAIDQHENAEELHRLTLALLLAGIIALAASGVASYWMAGRAMRPLAEALALQRRFVADASHELRTPLTLLSTRAQFLKRRDQAGVPSDVTESIDEIVTDSRALTGILDDLLIAADPRSVADPAPIDLTATADQAVALLGDDAAARGIAFHRGGVDEPVVVLGSAPPLLRLMIALASNAIDHADKAVSLTITHDVRWAYVRVTDDGPGFSPASLDNAFERFASNRETATHDAEGTRHYGLGLAIVAEIAHRHRGAVTIERSEAAGATVLARLPLAPE